MIPQSKEKKKKKMLYDDIAHYATSYLFGTSYIHVIFFKLKTI
jgi:hypothetical protein